MSIELDKDGYPRVLDEIDLATIVAPIRSGHGQGNPYHNPYTGQFSFAPAGVHVLRGKEHLKGISTQARNLIAQRAKASRATAMGAAVVNGNLHIVFLNNGKRVDSFAIPPKSARQQDNKGERGEKPDLHTLDHPQRDHIVSTARNHSITGDSVPEEIRQHVHQQRLEDLIHYLNVLLRKTVNHEKVSDTEMRIAAGRGLTRKVVATLSTSDIREVLIRLQSLGWEAKDLQKHVVDRLPMRHKNLIQLV